MAMRCALLVFSLFVAVSCAEKTADDTCPQSLLQKEDKKYLQVNGDVCYRFVTYADKHYKDANKYCKQDGGLLAMPKTQELNNYLVNTFNQTYKSTKPFWIGLHDKDDDSIFKWQDGTAMDWDNFAVDNGPENDAWYGLRAAFEDCVAVHKNGKWHDYLCEDSVVAWATGVEVNMPFVCQYGAPGTAPQGGESGKGSDAGKTPADPTKCPPFFCSKDCAMNGYKTDANNCQMCECNA